MEDLDDELLALTQTAAPKKEKRKRAKTYASDSEESDLVSDDSDSEDDAFADVKTWGPDLMGDAKDRNRLASLTELERETILAERRKRIDLLHEHQELKARIGEQLGRRSNRKKESGKGVELAKLKERRENRALKKAHYDDDIESDGQQSIEESDNYYEEDDQEDNNDSIPRKNTEATFEDALKIQLKRSEIEKWANAPFFSSAVTGCLVRIAVGMNKEKKEQVYRIAMVLGIGKYHRAYRFGKQMINSTLHVSHGKAEKEFLMDLASNGNITEAEWNRYIKTVQTDGQKLIKTDHVEKKEKELLKARTYIFSNADIDEMVKKKRAYDKLPVNIASEKLRLKQEYQEAVENNDVEKQIDLRRQLDNLDEKVKDATTKDTKLEQFTSLNIKNRDINYREGREAEKASILAKKQKGDRAYDPFARRKTAPKHVLNRDEKDEKEEDKDTEKNTATSMLKPGKTNLNLESSPSFKATKVVLDDDSFLDSIDISELEKDLQ